MGSSAEPSPAGRKFASVCDLCLEPVSGHVEREHQDVFLVRECPTHGARRFLVSRNGEAFERYDRFRAATLPAASRPAALAKRFFFLTPACNQGCTYCLNEANTYAYFEPYELERFAADLTALQGDTVSLVGGEPLSHPRFFDFARLVHQHGKKLQVFTNGLALADEQVVARLVEVSGGRCEVYMTFDGFAPELYAHAAAGRVRERKLAALANLERHGIPIGLHHTVVPEHQQEPGVDQAEALRALLAYAMGHECVRALAVQPVVAIGGARHLAAEAVCSVDRAMDQILAALPVPIARVEVYALQKLFGLVNGVLRLPRCPHLQVVVLIRRGAQWTGMESFVDCAALDRRLDARLSAAPLTRARMGWALLADVLACVRWRQLPALVRLAGQVLPVLVRALDISQLPRTILPIVATTVCDRFNYDDTLAQRCDKVVHTNVHGEVIAELASAMSLRQLRERAAVDAAGGAAAAGVRAPGALPAPGAPAMGA